MQPGSRPADLRTDIASFIKKAVTESPDNNLGPGHPGQAWAEPLVGFARGDDPLFAFYKKDIGEFYWLPTEVFSLAFPGQSARPEELAVVAWVLPQTEATRRAHRRCRRWPSEAWARSRKFGEEFNMGLRKRAADQLTRWGAPAAAPMALPQWSWETSPRYGYASSWSERHTAHAAGLGTFGLSDGLITPRGKAVRVGSVVARMPVPPAQRPYSGHHDWCLFYAADGACGKCIERCPVEAITEAGHDKNGCQSFVMGASARYMLREFGVDIEGCGLCQVKVPCEAANPTRNLKRPAK